ncbi:centrosomal protein of 76 kDa-like [Convolutriloba macropyga]|uniref:centrosomal protein of 76 kDa-like n=1 Tax=Convolutriloba macropyga TaxID=536237 RepID=UPI003F52565E
MSRNTENLTSDQLDALRLAIRTRLEQEGAQDAIREIANRSMERQRARNESVVQPHEMLEDFKKTGILETILGQLNESRGHVNVNVTNLSWSSEDHHRGRRLDSGSQKKSAYQKALKTDFVNQPSINPSRRYLYVCLHGGKAFTGFSEETSSFHDTKATISVIIDFRNQRFNSKSVPYCVEPAFDDSFLIVLADDKKNVNGKAADLNAMLSMSDPLHVIVLKTDTFGAKSVISSQFVEWRHLLHTQGMKERNALPVYGIGGESKINAGVLDITMEIMPAVTSTLQKEIVSTQFELEWSRVNEKNKSFFNYAKQWWKEYLQIRPENNQRLVKIFAQDENGTTRPVCSFVRPLRTGRVLESALQCTRFVSVLSSEGTDDAMGGTSSTSTWQSLFCTLAQNKGTSADHANLLCSLLIGFGLNAYVCFGTKSKQEPHSWVVIVGADNIVTFYESTTGHKYIHNFSHHDNLHLKTVSGSDQNSHPYVTIGCVYNNREFYANIQPSDRVANCAFDLLNDYNWKSMDREVLDSVCGSESNPFWRNIPVIQGPSLDTSIIAENLELDLMNLIVDHRSSLELDSVFDAGLAYILQPALSSYEMERSLGVSVGSDEFQNAIRQYIPDGETFKGCPLQVDTVNAKRVFNRCMKSQSCEEIISCRGDSVRLAARVKVVAFPENAVAVWLMLACKYKSIV